jgi:hypothetical protein
VPAVRAASRLSRRVAPQAPGVAAKATACSARRALPRHLRAEPAEPPPPSRAGLLRSASCHSAAAPRPASLLGTRAALLAASRDLFRLHVAADAQRGALASAAADAAAREAALKAAEGRFDADAMRFDAFLRDSDAALREARDRAATSARAAAEAEGAAARAALAADTERARADWLAERFAPPGWRLIWAAEAEAARQRGSTSSQW